ncbi:uncharacterized protein [Equus przewalskii]|uniref:Uncharacterized protein isoform X1 n=1 Tax=Equus przewalskii TaxID=9798 RepID=A0ABM4PZ39_EQUPR
MAAGIRSQESENQGDLTTPGLAVRLRPLAPFRAHRKPKNFLLCVQFSVTSLFTLLCSDHHRHPSPELFSFSQTEPLFSPNNGSPFPFLQPLATPFLLSDSESDYSRCPIYSAWAAFFVLFCFHLWYPVPGTRRAPGEPGRQSCVGSSGRPVPSGAGEEPSGGRLETQNGNGLVLLCQHQYRRSHKFLTNPTMSEPHGALETSQKFWGSVAGWFWLRISHVAVVRRHLGCTHLKARLGLEHLPSRYFTHMAAGNQKKPGGTFDILSGNLLC